MSNEELKQQFQLCEQWNDPEQWDFLAIAYYARGYYLNALHCFRLADTCRVLVAVKSEVER